MIIPHEKHSRSVVKSVVYRTLSISADSLVAYFFTRNAIATFTIVAIVNGYSTILYYLHERIWAHITWGQKK
ncbi:MAG: DUF2061 domain-containing protein [Candidatus Pacebacteria bacterium]|nr:DUF2061 domain-containing protein [Candidatus Paceibacterota bacterium]MCF7857563.1 DUF2061 domain-containing protein [Candidatus Paceibacterota bacterium]